MHVIDSAKLMGGGRHYPQDKDCHGVPTPILQGVYR